MYICVYPSYYVYALYSYIMKCFYYQVNERIIPTKTSSRTCWSINLNQHSVVIIFLNDEGRRETFGQC